MLAIARAYAAAGYDYMSVGASGMYFPAKERRGKNTVSLNEGYIITSRADYEKYQWPDADDFDDSWLNGIEKRLPEGMRLVVMGPGGVLENVITLVGYDHLCIMLYEDEALAKLIFDQVGSRLLKYYENALRYESVGAVISNDDWGFNTQTFLSPKDLRKYVFPWHERIVSLAHEKGRPTILHSCGNLTDVMDDVIDGMKFDGKHSFEDGIMPVEECYERWGSRIAIMGGIDMDFLIRRPKEEVIARCKAMLDRTRGRGGYALGSGNSIPEYVPFEQYMAMIGCINM